MSIQGPSPVGDTVPPALPKTPIGPSASQAPPSAAPAATATITPWAALLNKLQRVQQNSPTAFKGLVGHMADTVDTEARKATGADASSLAELGDQLKQVAKTGDLRVFKPTHHPHPTRAQPRGSAPTLLQTLLAQVDHVLGPGASPG